MSRPTATPRLLSLIATVWVGACSGQPILPSLSYPVFILTPPDVLKTEAGQQFHPIPDHQYPTVSDHSGPAAYSAPPEPGYEVSQFHSQDELGRVVFGFHGPDQSRMEARSVDGSVRGSYSYIDPNGNIVRMQYWDDGSGFHVTGNALPNGHPAYTPEVAAARAQHLKIYQAALQAAGHVLPPPPSDGTDDGDHTSSAHQFDDNLSQFDKETNTNTLFGEGDDSDSVSLDNPELFGQFNFQTDEKKEEEKPTVSEVEGEVELGEDVGPEEDENEEGLNEDHEEKDEEEEHDYFKKIKKNKNENEGNTRPKGNTQFKAVKGNEDVPKKFFNGQRYQEKRPAIKSPEKVYLNDGNQDDDNEEVADEEEDVHDDGEDHNAGEEDNHDDRQEGEEDEPNENHNDEENHNEDENQNKDENQEVEEGVDGEFDTVEHLFSPEDFDDENYGRRSYRERDDIHDEEEGYDEHGDADTAENRKTSMSHAMSNPSAPKQTAAVNSFEKADFSNTGEKQYDQQFERSDANAFLYEPQKAFYYHYLHTIPRPVERVDLVDEKPVYAASSPIGQVNTNVRAPLPLSGDGSQLTSIAQPPAVAQPLAGNVEGPSDSVNLASRRQPVTLLSPFTEVHDQQVSPYQAATNPHLFPIYMPEKVR